MAASRKLFVELGVNSRRLTGDLNKSEKKFQSWGQRTAKHVQKSFKAIKMAAGGAAAFAFGSVAKDVYEFEDTLDRLATQARMTGVETDALRQKMIGLSKESGVSRGQIAAAGKSLIDLGVGAEFADAALGVLVDASVATGTSMDDLASLAFSLKNNFGVESAEDLTAALNAVIEAGNHGNIPLDKMASTLKKVAATFAEFKGSGVQASAEVGVAMQMLGSSGFATAEEAGTGMVAMMSALKRSAGKLRKEGIDVFEVDSNGVKSFRTLEEIIAEIGESRLATDPELMLSILGSVEAEKAIKALVTQQELFKEQIGLALKSNAIEEMGARRKQSDAHRLQKAWNDVKESIAEAFTPERVETFVEAIEQASKFVALILDNLTAVAALWGSIKLAQGGSALLSAAGGAAGAAGKGAGALGALGGAGLVAAAGAAGYALGTFADEALGISDYIANSVYDILNPKKMKRGDEIDEATTARWARGEFKSPAELEAGRGGSRTQAFQRRGFADVHGLTAAEIEKRGGPGALSYADSIRPLRREDPANPADAKAMAHRALLQGGMSGGMGALADIITTAIRNAPIKVVVSGKELGTAIDNAPGGTST